MSSTIALLVVLFISIILINIGALWSIKIKYPEENREISIFGFFLMMLFLFGIGAFINHFFNWVGTCIIAGFYLIYIVYGFTYTLILRNKTKKL